MGSSYESTANGPSDNGEGGREQNGEEVMG